MSQDKTKETGDLNQPVVAGVNDLIVCIKETGIYLRLTFPRTILMQKTNDMGNILLQRSSGSISINGFIFKTLIAKYDPMAEHIKWTHDTDRGNLKSNFCEDYIVSDIYMQSAFKYAYALVIS